MSTFEEARQEANARTMEIYDDLTIAQNRACNHDCSMESMIVNLLIASPGKERQKAMIELLEAEYE